jgi:hypothetical protein
MLTQELALRKLYCLVASIDQIIYCHCDAHRRSALGNPVDRVIGMSYK